MRIGITNKEEFILLECNYSISNHMLYVILDTIMRNKLDLYVSCSFSYDCVTNHIDVHNDKIVLGLSVNDYSILITFSLKKKINDRYSKNLTANEVVENLFKIIESSNNEAIDEYLEVDNVYVSIIPKNNKMVVNQNVNVINMPDLNISFIDL